MREIVNSDETNKKFDKMYKDIKRELKREKRLKNILKKYPFPPNQNPFK